MADRLNSVQEKIVRHTEGAVMVTAGAGSGKTRVLTHRINHLIESGVQPRNILAITFTNKAAGEMRERLERMVDSRDMWITTFHSMCAKILRFDIDKLGYSPNYTIYTESDKERVIKRLVAEADIDKDKFYKTVANAISEIKNSNISIEEYRRYCHSTDTDRIAALATKYESELKQSNALDFDDLLLKVLELFKTNRDVLEKYQDKFRYIMVDEFQDTNEVQYAIVRLLAQKYGNIFVVGDEDQSIYGWRGADFRNLLKITKDFNCTIYKLEQNYRSTKRILETANRIIKNNRNRLEKTLFTEGEEGARVEIYSAGDENDEAEFVASQIHFLKQQRGYRNSDFAVLLRLNALTRPFEEKFMRYNLPHMVFGGIKFYERKEIKDVLAYLRIAANQQDKDSILRVINLPKRGIGNVLLGKLDNYCKLNNMSMGEVLLNLEESDLELKDIKKLKQFADVFSDIIYFKDKKTLTEYVRYVIERSGIKDSLSDDTEENINRRMNIDDLLSSVDEFERNNTENTLQDYLNAAMLYTDLDEMSDASDAVAIATMHSAKGLEFKVVFVIGLDEGVMPILRQNSTDGDIEEERRLMYVAVTRARERLYLSRAQSRFLYGERKYMMESRFLCECDENRKQKQEQRAAARYVQSGVREPIAGTSQTASPNAFGSVESFLNRPNLQRNTVDYTKYTVGTTVRHKKFGIGKIIKIMDAGNNTYVSVSFEGFGVKNIALEIAPLEVVE